MFAWQEKKHEVMVSAKAKSGARDVHQVAGTSSSETFGPTPASSCIYLLASMACEFGLNSCYLDAEQAFVRSEVEDISYALASGLR